MGAGYIAKRAQRDRAAKKRDASGERDNHQENDKGRFGSRAKDSFSKKARQNYPERVTGSPAYESEQKCFCRKQEATVPEPAPSAFIKPISVRRSITEAAEEAPTANAAASSAAPVTSHNSMRTRVRIAPSPSATRRTTRTSAPGNTCLIE